jgi:hypothetical protein
MIVSGLMVLLSAGAPPPGERIEYAQITIHTQVIVRVPTQRVAPPTTYHASKAARCQPLNGVAGAAVMGPDSVDIMYRGGTRIRAELEEECPALDYYSGFYVQPTADKQICAGRDSIHSRAGGECQIRRFRKLIPDRPAKASRK